MGSAKLRQRIAETAVIVGIINVVILITISLIAAVRWSIQTFAAHPFMVIAAWSGCVFIVCVLTLVIMIVMSQEKEEEETDVE